jgi:UDP-glucose 4-epimerase
MKCLVLGGGGFIGSNLCHALLAIGDSVRVFENKADPSNGTLGQRLEWCQGDFNDREQVAQALRGCDVVYHLVSTTLPKTSNEDPIYDVQSNVVSTLQMLEEATKEGVRKMIFVSSGGTVYGIPQQTPIPETHPTNPICSYGIGKLTIEKYLHLFHALHGLDYCILRLSNPFGEHQRATGSQGAIAVFLHKALRGETIEIWGDGSVVRDYLYISNAVDALIKARTYSGQCRIFNIGSGAGHSLNDVISRIEELAGSTVRRKYLPVRAFDVPINVLDISRAAEVLEWRPAFSFEEGLRRTWKWLQEQRQEDVSPQFSHRSDPR